jgi:hypothetical protein
MVFFLHILNFVWSKMSHERTTAIVINGTPIYGIITTFLKKPSLEASCLSMSAELVWVNPRALHQAKDNLQHVVIIAPLDNPPIDKELEDQSLGNTMSAQSNEKPQITTIIRFGCDWDYRKSSCIGQVPSLIFGKAPRAE